MDNPDETFHRGERLMQSRAGVADRMAAAGPRVIRDFMTEQHRDFFEQLPFVVVGSVDGAGQPWASVLAGYPGFMAASADLLAAADTFFIASAYPVADEERSHGVDVSHRGGNPGFIEVADGVLRIPDYTGNNYFNTLGNLAVNPRAGLLVVDFATGDLLFVAVTVEIVWSGPEVEAVPGAKRLLVMKVAGVIRMERALGLNWGEAERSPFLAGL